MRERHIIFMGVFSFLLLIFTAYVALDSFVIERVITPGDQPAPMSAQAEELSAGGEDAAAQSDVTLTQVRWLDTDIYVADVRLSSPDALKTALAKNAYGKNVTQTTSEMAAQNGALLAVNGDYYGAREKGYVVRNGVLYRDVPSGSEDLVIYEDGSAGIIREDEVTAAELMENGAYQVFSFGPALVEDGVISVDANDEVGRARASNPRTAVGIAEDGHYVFVVSDGRTAQSRGLTLYELAQFMQSLGVTTAYNLDGGGSSTMVYQGEVVNLPVARGSTVSERKVSDIVYIGCE